MPATPYHLHHARDESFFLLEGEATFVCDGKKIHSGRFENFVTGMGEPATQLALPEPAPPGMEKRIALAAKYKIEILGPLPE